MSDNANVSNPLFSNEVVVQKSYYGEIRRDCKYGTSDHLFDIYYPRRNTAAVAAVILVTGYADPGFRTMTGMQLREIGQLQSWARLIAASGMAAITYTNVDPVQDAISLVQHVIAKGEALGIDANRMALWSASGNVPNALHVLQTTAAFRCAVLCYGFMLDGAGESGVSDAAQQFRFANPNPSGMELSTDAGLLLVRAGQDEFAGLNSSIDRLLLECLDQNLDIELINYAEGVHAFDILDKSVAAQNIVLQILDYLGKRLASTG